MARNMSRLRRSNYRAHKPRAHARGYRMPALRASIRMRFARHSDLLWDSNAFMRRGQSGASTHQDSQETRSDSGATFNAARSASLSPAVALNLGFELEILADETLEFLQGVPFGQGFQLNGFTFCESTTNALKHVFDFAWLD